MWIINHPVQSRLVRSLIMVVVLSVAVACTGCQPEQSLDKQIQDIAAPYRFSIASWEIAALSREFDDWLFTKPADPVEGSVIVIEYFQNLAVMQNLENSIALIGGGMADGDYRATQEQYEILQTRNQHILPYVEDTIAAQIEKVLAEEGITAQSGILGDIGIFFPPVSFTIQQPPNLLVISPRDQITRLKDITLKQYIDLDDIEAIEEQLTQMGLSALVVRLGGIATYPAFVAEYASLQYTLETVVEEWFHQYLFFKPLGFLYGLHIAGIKPDYDLATLNEGFAGIVSGEVARLVYQQYYQPALMPQAMQLNSGEGEFDYYAEMRHIRLAVDDYLSKGMITEAEKYMEDRRLYLASHGYLIRKLNQAYFAFYGTYADSPSSVSPIGVGLRALRKQSATLREYVECIASMTSIDIVVDAAREQDQVWY